MSSRADDLAEGMRVLEEVVRTAARHLTDLMIPTDGDLIDVIEECDVAILLPEQKAALRRALSASALAIA